MKLIKRFGYSDNIDSLEKPKMHKNMERPVVLIRTPLAKMEDKAAEPDQVVIEVVIALDDFDIVKVTEMINEIYNSGEILEHLRR